MILIGGIPTGIVAALVYAATQVSPATWDRAVLMVAFGIAFALGCGGVAVVVRAFHRPPDDNRQVTTIDKAVFLEGPEGREIVKW